MLSRRAVLALATVTVVGGCAALESGADPVGDPEGAADPIDAVGALTPPRPLRVYVIAGQSNAVGGARVDDLPPALARLADPVPGVRQAFQLNCPKNGIDGACAETAAWAALAPRAGGYFGIELTLGRRLAERFGPVAIIKTATNGSGLYAQWEPDAPDGRWQWQYMIDEIDARMAELPAGSELAGLILVNGEGDAANITIARAYAAALGYFVLRFRDELGADLPVVVSELGHAALPQPDEVRAGQHRVADHVRGVAVAPTTDLAYRDGIQHYDAASFAALGTRIADLFPADPDALR